METLTPETTASAMVAYSSQLVNASFAIFGVTFLVIVLLFFWQANKSVRSAFGIAILIGLSLLMPISLQVLSQTTAGAPRATSGVQIAPILTTITGPGTYRVQIQTLVPAFVFLEYRDFGTTDEIPILPTNYSQKQTVHLFTVISPSRKGGTIVLVIDGQRYLVNGAPLSLR